MKGVNIITQDLYKGKRLSISTRVNVRGKELLDHVRKLGSFIASFFLGDVYLNGYGVSKITRRL